MNRRIPVGTYGGVRGRLSDQPPTLLIIINYLTEYLKTIGSPDSSAPKFVEVEYPTK